MNRWIKLETRNPELSGRYPIWIRWSPGSELDCIEMGTFWAEETHEMGVLTQTGDWVLDDPDCKVILYWMDWLPPGESRADRKAMLREFSKGNRENHKLGYTVMPLQL